MKLGPFYVEEIARISQNHSTECGWHLRYTCHRKEGLLITQLAVMHFLTLGAKVYSPRG